MEQEKLFNIIEEEKKEVRKKQRRQNFRAYDQEQTYLFPDNLNEYIGPYHIARLVSIIVDKIDLREVEKSYKGGASAYEPKMMLKVWLLAYLNRIYTSRPLEKALKENVAFMWISGKQEPDYRTLCNFRLRLDGDIKSIFKKFIKLFVKKGIIKGEDIFADHTKFEANANRHKIIWKKTVEKRKVKIEEELNKLISKIEKIQREEASEKEEFEGKRIEEMLKSNEIEGIIGEINQKLAKKEISREEAQEEKKDLRRIRELNRQKEEYNKKEENLEERKSYSKTDIDATAMMMKDEVLRPGYNEGIAVDNGFVVGYIESQNAADSVSFKELVEEVKKNTGKTPKSITADGAYGSEENLEYMEEERITSYVKYNTFTREQSKKYYEERIRFEAFRYDKGNDTYQCPGGAVLYFQNNKENITATGYKQKIRIYAADENWCKTCPQKSKCTESGRRTLAVNENYNRLKQKTKENLLSKKGIEKRKQRGYNVETVFGDRKGNHKFKRFVLKSKGKGEFRVKIESGLYYIMHNIKRLYPILLKTIENGSYERQLAISWK